MGAIRPKDFTNLHVHSEYSLLDAALKIPILAQTASEMGHRSIALTDHGSVDGISKFEDACREHSIQPIYGCEIYLIEKHWDRHRDRQKKLHLTVHAKNMKGLRGLFRLLNKGHEDRTPINDVPAISLDYLLEEKALHGNIIILSGCASSPFWNLEKGPELFARYAEAYGKDFYGEVMPLHDADDLQGPVNASVMASGVRRIVATNDIHYPCKKDKKSHSVVLCIRQRRKWSDPRRWDYGTKLNFFRTPKEMVESLIGLGMDRKSARRAILNTAEIAEKCNFELPNIPVELPKVMPKGINEGEWIAKKCYRRMENLGLDNERYYKRLEAELESIVGGGFSRYICMVTDLIKWAQKTGVEVGPGRGCFLPNQEIQLLKGKKKISQVSSGDICANGNEIRSVLKYDCVDEDISLLETKGGVVVYATQDHKIKTESGWKRAREISAGEKIQTVNQKGQVNRLRLHRKRSECSHDVRGEIDALQGSEKDYWRETIEADCIRGMLSLQKTLLFPISRLYQKDILQGEVGLQGMFEGCSPELPCLEEEEFERTVDCSKETRNKKEEQFGRSKVGEENERDGSGLLQEKVSKRDEESELARGPKKTDGTMEPASFGRPRFCLEDLSERVYFREVQRNSFPFELGTDVVGLVRGKGYPNKKINYPDKISDFKERQDISSGLRNREPFDRSERMPRGYGEDCFEISFRPQMVRKEWDGVSSFEPSEVKRDRNLDDEARSKGIHRIKPKHTGDASDEGFEEIVRVRKIRGYSGPVYDLAVSGDHTYTLDGGLIVHNSVSGSLICFLLGITQIDPIKYGLVFERFISEGRIDLPDIDIDVEKRKRPLVEQYLKEKYGEEHVAHVSTFGTLKAKAALKDTCRIFEIPEKEAQQLSNQVAAGADKDPTIEDTVKNFEYAKKFAKKYPHVIKNAKKIEGQVRGVGVHAAGLVVSKDSLRTADNCYLTVRKGTPVINWDRDDLDRFGFMKLDILGLATLSVLAGTRELVKKRHNVDIDFTNLPLDDKETFEDIAEGRTATCFQIGSKGLQRFCKQLSISDLDSLCATSALWRPGPLRSGMTNKYTACKLGKEKPKYFHSIYKEITKDTQGQLIYQEQVMFLMHELAGIPWDKVDKVRKVISKSKGGKEWEKYQSMFVKGCKKKGTMKRGAAIKFWNRLESYASYSFNKSHAVAYGIIGYWTAYCKTHYPLEYLCAYLNYGSVEGFDPNSKVKKKNIALAEARRLKIKIKPPDINLSNKGWTIEGKSLRAGVSEITGVGQAATDAIFKGRVQCGGKFSDITQMVISVDRRRVHRGVINKLCLSGTLDALLNEDAKYWKASFEKMLAACTSPKKYEKTKEEITNEVELEYDKIKDELDRIRQECIDYQLSETAMGEHEQFYKTLCEFVKITPNSTVKDGMKKGGKTKLYCGVAANVKVAYGDGKRGKKGQIRGVYSGLEDGKNYVSVIYDRDLYRKRKATIEGMEGAPVLVKGVVPKGDKISIQVSQVWTLEELEKGRTRGLKLGVIQQADVPKELRTEYRGAVKECNRCSLRENCKLPVPASMGNTNVMVVGEAPGREEDEQGKGFVGKSGKLLFKELAAAGIERQDVFVSNSVKCRPPGNKLPNVTYISKCPWLALELETFRPRVVLAVGNSALYFFRRETKGITAWNGRTEWNSRWGCWVTYCIHPASVLYHRENMKLLKKAVGSFADLIGRFS